MTGFDNITVADVNKMQYLYKQYACLGLLSLLEDTLIQSDCKDILLKDPTDEWLQTWNPYTGS